MATEEHLKERLVEIGLHIQNIRELYSWNQYEFALRLGVSRPTISNAERQPDRLSKTVALAMFLVAVAELNHRKQVVRSLTGKSAQQQAQRVLVDQLRKWGTSVPNSVISSIGSRAEGFFQQRGLTAAAKLAGTLTESVLQMKQMSDKDDIQGNLAKIITYQEDLLQMIEEKLTIYFGTLDPAEFVQSLEMK